MLRSLLGQPPWGPTSGSKAWLGLSFALISTTIVLYPCKERSRQPSSCDRFRAAPRRVGVISSISWSIGGFWGFSDPVCCRRASALRAPLHCRCLRCLLQILLWASQKQVRMRRSCKPPSCWQLRHRHTCTAASLAPYPQTSLVIHGCCDCSSWWSFAHLPALQVPPQQLQATSDRQTVAP